MEDLRRHRPSEPVDLLLEEPVRRLQQPQAGLAAGDERALPLAAVDQPAALEARERLPDGRARQGVVLAQLRLRGQTQAGLPAAADDLLLEQLRELEVERDRRRAVDADVRELAGQTFPPGPCLYGQDDVMLAPRSVSSVTFTP
jgi:hypothetical protein